MKLLVSQKNQLAELIENRNIDLKHFEFIETDKECLVVFDATRELLFQMRGSIQNAEFCDIFYRPTKKNGSGHVYLAMDKFEDIIPCFQEWLDCLTNEIGVQDKWNNIK